ncbi:ATP-binding protein [Candidatus Woesearchaeota archaeon]|nr:ATP-binding protein [Candidatus Woesearchaeota archaeon]
MFFIIIRGPLGCGKSTIAKKLAKNLNAECIPIDRVLDEYDLTKDKEEGYIAQKSFLRANAIIVPKAERMLEGGKIVIFDGNFYWRSQIDDLIKQLKFPHFVFTLKAPVDVCISRDIERGKTHGEDAARVVHNKSTEFDYGNIIDVNRPIEDCIKEILRYIKNK